LTHALSSTSAQSPEASEPSAGAVELRCPRCRDRLSAAGDGLACLGCSTSFPLRDGIRSFTDIGYFYGTLPRESVRDLIDLASRNRMGELRRYLAERKIKGRKVFLRSFQDSFADGRFLAPLGRDATILDLGCGYGGLSIPLARSYGRVVAVDATLERVKIVGLRAEHEGLHNVVPVHANALELPFGTAAFDCVVVNGVLEWVGEWDTSRAPGEVQLAVLRRCHELLKPGGTLLLAIENRWGLELIYRRKDHNKLYWTSFMPRALADALTRLLKRKPYRTYTYGRGALVELLERAGFARVDLYCPWPRYQDPDFIVRCDDEPAFDYFRCRHMPGLSSPEAGVFGLLAKLGVHWTFAPAWIALARRP
jgi:SAM-dependent methyltransferase